MIKRIASLLAAAVLAIAAFAPAPVSAQQTAKVIATCGTASYTAATTNYITIDTTGAACSAGGGGGGTSNVNITGINGAAPSLTNPLFIANAEAADASGTFTNATQTTSITNTNADGYATALLSINGTYGTASGVFEESDDGGTTYYSINCARSDGSATETGYTSLTNTNRQWSCPVAGNDAVRIRSTAVASGTVNVRVGISAPTNNSGVTVSTQPTASALNAQVVGNVAALASDSGNPVKVGGVFTTAAPSLSDGQRGNLRLDSSAQLKVAAAAQSQFTLSDGNATNTALTFERTGAAGFVPVAELAFNGGSLDKVFTCPNMASVNVTAGNTTQIVALSGSTVIRICSANLGESLAGTFAFTSGTGTNCATPANAMAAIPLATSATFVSNGGTSAIYRGSAGGEFCITAATGNITGWVAYAQY